MGDGDRLSGNVAEGGEMQSGDLRAIGAHQHPEPPRQGRDSIPGEAIPVPAQAHAVPKKSKKSPPGQCLGRAPAGRCLVHWGP